MGEAAEVDDGLPLLGQVIIDVGKLDGEESGTSTAETADPLVGRIGEKLRKLPPCDTPADRPCISRVHPSIRDQESTSYEPKLVSIGPLHHGKASLLPMEDVKLAFLGHLLERSKHNELGNYVSTIRECEGQARAQYAQGIGHAVDEFVEMLVVDGCFIIEYFAKRVLPETQEMSPLSSVRWGFSHLRSDLMLLENQIPFFVLLKLFEHTKIPFRGTRVKPLTLMEISLRFLGIRLPSEEEPRADGVLHLLHLYHLCLNPGRVHEEPLSCSCGQVLYPLKKAADLMSLLLFGLLYLVFIRQWPRCFSPPYESKKPRMIPSATELVEAGVRFRRKDSDRGGVSCFLKVSFTEGTLEIPSMKVEESTSCKLRNLIALEQCCPQVGSYFTSYGILVDNLINTEDDVVVLRGAGIIESKLGSNAEVAALFNTLCKGTHFNYDDHYNAPLFVSVKQYCEFAHHRWRANLVHKYFNNPWTLISLLAACLLLSLTAIQTYFTVFP